MVVSQNPKANQIFLDTVLKLVNTGQFKLTPFKDQAKAAQGVGALYDPNTDALNIPSGFTFSLAHRQLLVHELIHFYQDFKKQKLSIDDQEKEANQLGAEYILHDLGIIKSSKPADLDQALITMTITDQGF